jgi:tetratricopeptide (TPR) repeat protein
VAILGTLLLLALVGGTAGMAYLWRHAEAQRERAEENFQRAEENFKRAEENSQRAEENFQTAFQFVEDYYSIQGKEQSRLPDQLRPVGEDLLERAIRHFTSLRERRPGDPMVLDRLAQAYIILGQNARENARATEALRQAIEAYQELAQGTTNTLSYRLRLAHAWEWHSNKSGDTEGTRIALEIREQLAKEYPDDPRVLSSLALSLFNHGFNESRMGRSAEALGLLSRARALREQIDSIQPEGAGNLLELSRIHELTGQIQISANEARRPEGLRSYERAYEIAERVVTNDPKDEAARVRLVQVAARAAVHAQGLAATSAWGRKAAEQYEELRRVRLRRSSALADDSAGLARVYYNMGEDLAKATEEEAWHHTLPLLVAGTMGTAGLPSGPGPLAAAAALFPGRTAALCEAESRRLLPKALALAEELLGSFSEDQQLRYIVATATADLAQLAEPAGATSETAPLYRQAATLLEQVVKATPGYDAACSELGQVWEILGNYDAGLERHQEAEQAFRRAIAHQQAALDKDPQYWQLLGQHYQSLAQNLRAQGRIGEADVAAAKDAGHWPKDPEQLFAGAREVAGGIASMSHWQLHPSPALLAERDRLADRAMAILRRAVANGFKDHKKLAEEEQLVFLRSRPDFQELLKALTR